MKLKTDTKPFDPTIVDENDNKVAVLVRNHDKNGYVVGICFDLKDYEPVEVSCLQEGVFKVIDLLKQAGIDASV